MTTYPPLFSSTTRRETQHQPSWGPLCSSLTTPCGSISEQPLVSLSHFDECTFTLPLSSSINCAGFSQLCTTQVDEYPWLFFILMGRLIVTSTQVHLSLPSLCLLQINDELFQLVTFSVYGPFL